MQMNIYSHIGKEYRNKYQNGSEKRYHFYKKTQESTLYNATQFWTPGAFLRHSPPTIVTEIE